MHRSGSAATGRGARTYHHTAPTAMVASLHAGLGRVLEEGLDSVIARPDIVTLILGALGEILDRS